MEAIEGRGGRISEGRPAELAETKGQKARSVKPARHAPFDSGFVWAALAAAILGGFSLAAYLSYALSREIAADASVSAAIHLHGRIQAHGFVGLMMMGVSLHMIPRLFSRPIPWKWAPKAILFLGLAGIGLAAAPAGTAWAIVGGAAHCAGILLYLSTLGTVVVRSLVASKDPSLVRLVPYLLCSGFGWGWAALLIAEAAAGGEPLGRLHSEILLYLVFLPTALLFSAKLLPLFLGLREPRWPVGWIGALYLAGAALAFFGPAASVPISSPLGRAVMGMAILAFVSCLDLLHRRVPERLGDMYRQGALRGRAVGATESSTGSRTRWLPDNGQFGRFELCILSAYLWLAAAAIGELLCAALALFGRAPHAADALRHAYLLGFVTNLIIGVGLRLLPPLLSRRIVWRGAAAVAAALLNPSALSRVVPSLVFGSPSALAAAPDAVRRVFSLSGSLALAAIAVFGVALIGRRRVLY